MPLFDNGINDIRIISCATVVVILGIAIVGTEWETKVNIYILFYFYIKYFMH